MPYVVYMVLQSLGCIMSSGNIDCLERFVCLVVRVLLQMSWVFVLSMRHIRHLPWKEKINWNTTRADGNCEQLTWWRCEYKKSGGIKKIRRNWKNLEELKKSRGIFEKNSHGPWTSSAPSVDGLPRYSSLLNEFCSLKSACYVTRAAAKSNHERLVLLPLWNMYKIFYK